MRRPSLRHLEAFVSVAEHLSFRRAAAAVFVTQPALSVQIRQMELILGVRLFERDRRRVLLTREGVDLLPRARRALAEIDGLVSAAGTLHDPFAGTLGLGVIPTIAPYVLPRAVRAARRRLPRLHLRLTEERTATLVELVRNGRLDAALLALEADLGDLERLPLYADPFLLAVPAGHELAGRKSASDSDLDGQEVLLLEEGHCLREQALAVCARAGAGERDDFRATSLNTLARMISGGIGITLLPAMAVPDEVHSGDGVSVIPLESRALRTIGLVWRRTTPRSAALEALAAILRELAPRGTSAIVPRPRARAGRRSGP